MAAAATTRDRRKKIIAFVTFYDFLSVKILISAKNVFQNF
jgi:hypothetical protein